MQKSDRQFIYGMTTFLLISIVIMLTFAIQSPREFPEKKIDISIDNNIGISRTADLLYNNKIIKSPFLFKTLSVLFGGWHGVIAGDYRFTEPVNLIKVVYRINKGDQGLPKIKIMIPEGTNVDDMASIFLNRLENFNAPKFVSLARSKEGYLFPDTYYFLSNTKPEQIIKEMQNNFYKKISRIKSDINNSGKKLNDIIIMASIIEKEVRTMEDKRMVSGILWNRLNKNMLLQVDAPFYYITGNNSKVTYNTLKIDSPYNTYKSKGLPKGPITNPGMNSIIAAITPLSSKYYFYLTDKDGVTRYATTYDGHLKNKYIYLN